MNITNYVIAHNDCEGIRIDNGSWGCTIQNSHIYTNGWRDRQTETESGIDYVNEIGLLPDQSSQAKLPDISINNSLYTRTLNNRIEEIWGDEIKLVRAGVETSIFENRIQNNNRGANDNFHFFGILLGVASRQHPDQQDYPSCNNRIIGNEIIGKHFAGIQLMPGVQGNVIQFNHISGAQLMSIEDHVDTGNLVDVF